MCHLRLFDTYVYVNIFNFAKGESAMNLLYEDVYRKKQEQYKLDGDLQAFNGFISKAQDFQLAVAAKAAGSETEYTSWLSEQLLS